MFCVLRHYLMLAAFFLRGRYFRLARERRDLLSSHWRIVLEEKQAIHATEFASGKIANMQRAIGRFNGLVMPPGSWFSWWHFVPRPAAHNGFVLGRTLVSGRLAAGYGGGLCQLSGIMYLAALKLGMAVHERHAHSRDIYREDERYTPLGADAAIVFGHKNLVFRNTTSHVFVWIFEVEQAGLLLRVYAKETVNRAHIEFRREDKAGENLTAVTTLRHSGETTETVSRSVYLQNIENEKF